MGFVTCYLFLFVKTYRSKKKWFYNFYHRLIYLNKLLLEAQPFSFCNIRRSSGDCFRISNQIIYSICELSSFHSAIRTCWISCHGSYWSICLSLLLNKLHDFYALPDPEIELTTAKWLYILVRVYQSMIMINALKYYVGNWLFLYEFLRRIVTLIHLQLSTSLTRCLLHHARFPGKV